jgi:hypothetical protein
MNSNKQLEKLLSKLKLAALAVDFSKDGLVSVIEDLLLWLNDSRNNTDSNCKLIDYFIAMEIIPEKRFEDIPEDVRNILFDMGTTLHDSHISPDIASNC